MKLFRVWRAGGHDVTDGTIVKAESREQAAQLGAAALYEPADPLGRFDVFVRSAHAKQGPAARFTILVDVSRVRLDEQAGTATVESVTFTPCLFQEPGASMQAV